MEKIKVIIPVLNEQESIGKVLEAIPDWVDEIIVVDNGSSDNTIQNAREKGATVFQEIQRGYGAACLKGISKITRDTGIVVFLDGDFSDHPEEMKQLVEPILNENYELVIGSRIKGKHEPGALLPVARFGNWLSTRLIKLGWGFTYSDLGPFRAIKRTSLEKLKMRDTNFGWTVEMQVKAVRHGLKICEVPVSYRKRIGKSKVSGTIKGSFLAGQKILLTIGSQWIQSKFSFRKL